MQKIITLDQARELGLKRYFTGNVCKRGHLSERYTKFCVCIECTREDAAVFRTKNPPTKLQRYLDRQKQLAKNPDYYRNSLRKWSEKEENRENQRESRRRSKRKHPETVRADAIRRRAKCKGESFTKKDLIFILEKQRYKCLNCKKSVKKKYHIDHIMPLAKGGTNDKKNLQILCPTCNLKKHAKDPIDWAQENGRLL